MAPSIEPAPWPRNSAEMCVRDELVWRWKSRRHRPMNTKHMPYTQHTQYYCQLVVAVAVAKDTPFYLHAFSSTRFATFPPTDYLCLRFNWQFCHICGWSGVHCHCAIHCWNRYATILTVLLFLAVFLKHFLSEYWCIQCIRGFGEDVLYKMTFYITLHTHTPI